MKTLDNILTIMTALVISASCTLADINEPTDSELRVDICMDWSQAGGESSASDSMYVVATHLVSPMILGYQYPDLLCLNDSVSLEDPMVWPVGDYALLSFTKQEGMSFSNVRDMNRLCVSMPVLTEAESAGIFGGRLKDFNPDIRTIGDVGDFHVDTKIHTLSAGDGNTEIVFEPKPLTQNLTVRFSLIPGEDIEIKDIVVTLSGLVGNVYPMAGVVDYENLCKMILSAERVEETDGRYVYEAKANILGLFPSESETNTAGNGILQLAISTESFRGEKVFYAGMNLRNTIVEAAPMTVNEDNMGFCIAKTDVVLDIASVLEISNESLVLYDPNDGVDAWFENETIDVEL